MKEHFYTVIFLTVIVLLPVLQLEAQEEKNEFLWYCWEETVKPEKWEEYIDLSKELIQLCKQENFSFPFLTWNGHSMVYELWTPLKSHAEIDSLHAAWAKIIKIWGEEKYAAFSQTKLHDYSKTTTVLGDLTYRPENPQYNGNERIYGRWIEICLKTGTQKEFMEAVKLLNEQRSAHGIEEYLLFAEGGMGYQAPSFLAIYTHVSQQALNEYYESTPQAYKEKFEEYLETIRKLMIKPPIINQYSLLWELSYTPEDP